jgi:hypothetical protein
MYNIDKSRTRRWDDGEATHAGDETTTDYHRLR